MVRIDYVFPVYTFERQQDGTYSLTGLGVRTLKVSGFPGSINVPLVVSARAEAHEAGQEREISVSIAGPDLRAVGRWEDTITITSPDVDSGSTLPATTAVEVPFTVPSAGRYTFNVRIDQDERSFELLLQ